MRIAKSCCSAAGVNKAGNKTSMHFLHESHPCDSLCEQLSVAATGCSEVLEPLGATLVVHCERTKSYCSAIGVRPGCEILLLCNRNETGSLNPAALRQE